MVGRAAVWRKSRNGLPRSMEARPRKQEQGAEGEGGLNRVDDEKKGGDRQALKNCSVSVFTKCLEGRDGSMWKV